jgi:hypothetical protein
MTRERGRPATKAMDHLRFYMRVSEKIKKGHTQRNAVRLVSKMPDYEGRSRGGLWQTWLDLNKTHKIGQPDPYLFETEGIKFWPGHCYQPTPARFRMIKALNYVLWTIDKPQDK